MATASGTNCASHGSNADGIPRAVLSKIPQQHVALVERLVVVHYLLQVGPVKLRDHRIEPFASEITSLVNQRRIIRRNHYRRKPSDVIGHAFVGLLIATKYFFDPSLDGTTHLFALIMAEKTALNQHVRLVVRDILSINWIEIALGVT